MRLDTISVFFNSLNQTAGEPASSSTGSISNWASSTRINQMFRVSQRCRATPTAFAITIDYSKDLTYNLIRMGQNYSLDAQSPDRGVSTTGSTLPGDLIRGFIGTAPGRKTTIHGDRSILPDFSSAEVAWVDHGASANFTPGSAIPGSI